MKNKTLFPKPCLALPMPSDCIYDQAKNLIRAVFNRLGARIVREGFAFIVAEVQPDVFIEGNYSNCGRNRNKIHWVTIYNNITDENAGCFTSADRPFEALAKDIRTRVIPKAVESCKVARERHIKQQSEKLTGEIRLAQLETIMGPLDDRNGTLISGPYTMKLEKYDLECEKFSARISITVRDWHCFLMIARLLKESERLG